jgi:hypothetical protein
MPHKQTNFYFFRNMNCTTGITVKYLSMLEVFYPQKVALNLNLFVIFWLSFTTLNHYNCIYCQKATEKREEKDDAHTPLLANDLLFFRNYKSEPKKFLRIEKKRIYYA